uniref:Probable serine/threonine-protein kinase DDB_G0278845 n=1 Tax=Nicotiana tabacum TaxID=4097 RepID=A0A1S3XXQ8_TOBAC|nr:PREDICTED: probable serine/threonine-protein kinase DDB_G0278845 [Nicotiana tabacum]
MTSVDPTIASTVTVANTSKQAWDSLPLPVQTNELATAGASVTNSELNVKILSGLGPEFRGISGAIWARDTTVTYEELYEKFLDHELFLRHEEAKKTPGPITTAVATHNKSNYNSNSSNNRCQYYYYNNNNNNNNNSQPWSKNTRPNTASQYHPPNNNTTVVIPCQLCNKIGHIASVCRSKSYNHFEAKANYITGFNTTANPWIVDSGATHHITKEPHNLQPYHSNEDVSMGDGNKILISHTGFTQL